MIVPGIGGSELLRGDELVWGGTLKVLASGLLSGRLFDDLRGELRPGGLLRVPTHLPVFGRFDPYSKLTEALRKLALDADAVLAFAYDWRQSVSNNAQALSVAANEHLDRWRRHSLGSEEAQLSLVCHSMGGLVARHYAEVWGGRAPIRQIVTLGTPFGGSVKAVRALVDGRVLKGGLRSRKLRELARELPSVHDLLPTYPAVASSTGNRRPTEDDIAATGTSRDLIRQSAEGRGRLTRALSENGASSCPVVPLVGVSQPTVQSFRVTDGLFEFLEHIDNRDWEGDGTVYWGAAFPVGQDHSPFPLQHGALANTNEAIEFVKHVLLFKTLGPPQGAGLGIAVPDAALVREPFTIRIRAPVTAGITCRYSEGTRSIGGVQVRRQADQLTATLSIPYPGLYTITASGGGFSPVSADIVIVPDEE